MILEFKTLQYFCYVIAGQFESKNLFNNIIFIQKNIFIGIKS